MLVNFMPWGARTHVSAKQLCASFSHSMPSEWRNSAVVTASSKTGERAANGTSRQRYRSMPQKLHARDTRACSTYSTLPQKSTHIRKSVSVSCNIECRVPSKQLGWSKGVCKFQKHSTYSTFPLKKKTLFWRLAFEHIQHIQHFRSKKHIFGKIVSFSFNVECRVPSKRLGCSKGSASSKIIQHIQHFHRKKKNFFDKRLLNIFNIFNISQK